MTKEYAWDFVEADDFLFTNGRNTVVTGVEAVKVWAWKALQTPKGRYKAYSWNFGNELEALIDPFKRSSKIRDRTVSERILADQPEYHWNFKRFDRR